MAVGAGFFKWQTASATEIRTVAAQSTAAASEHAIALLSYKADTVDKQLTAATSFLTGGFRDDYVKLIHDVVIPGAKQKGISAQATVPAAASVSTESTRSVVLLFIDQTVTVGSGPPTTTSSSVQVTLQKEGDQWLIAQFDPV
jgi:Mce-associated membrane protein